MAADNTAETVERLNEQLAESALWHLRFFGPMTSGEMLRRMAESGFGPRASTYVGQTKQLERAIRSQAGQRRQIVEEAGIFPPAAGSGPGGRPARVRWRAVGGWLVEPSADSEDVAAVG